MAVRRPSKPAKNHRRIRAKAPELVFSSFDHEQIGRCQAQLVNPDNPQKGRRATKSAAPYVLEKKSQSKRIVSMLDITDMNAPSQVFVVAARALADLKRQPGPNQKENDTSATALEQAMLSLAPYLKLYPQITSEAIIANSPSTIRLLSKFGRLAHPDPSSEEMKAIGSHVIETPEVEAAIAWIEAGGVLSLPSGSGQFVKSICEHDCPRRLALLIALKDQRPAFYDEVSDVFAGAGPRTGKALIEAHKAGIIDLSLIFSLLPIDEISLKEYAWLISNGQDLSKILPLASVVQQLPPDLGDLIKMTQSNHGRLQLKSLEPSLEAICAANPADSFYGFISPETYLLKDARKAM
jgi:hypothetical protein